MPGMAAAPFALPVPQFKTERFLKDHKFSPFNEIEIGIYRYTNYFVTNKIK